METKAGPALPTGQLSKGETLAILDPVATFGKRWRAKGLGLDFTLGAPNNYSDKTKQRSETEDQLREAALRGAVHFSSWSSRPQPTPSWERGRVNFSGERVGGGGPIS